MVCHLRSVRCLLATTIVLGLVLNATGLFAVTSEMWGNLVPGPYAVGFTTVEELDRSRSVGPKYDYFGNLREVDRTRQIQVCIWYPALLGEGATQMVFGEYAFP